ncbi:hypothetical protein [Burkholderia sp. FL-7-2-10-S1-D7]|uniref:hypothetical protein n=1 Tax=Burkholderia sp. FL-7-2-10-S1-D7 TaxID=1637866 RepID=UPI0012E3704B|nr:hypothetical protein [Burkholderia sp. FL-7-2-10-S1-D7]
MTVVCRKADVIRRFGTSFAGHVPGVSGALKWRTAISSGWRHGDRWRSSNPVRRDVPRGGLHVLEIGAIGARDRRRAGRNPVIHGRLCRRASSGVRSRARRRTRERAPSRHTGIVSACGGPRVPMSTKRHDEHFGFADFHTDA